jgi:hypothetical protein
MGTSTLGQAPMRHRLLPHERWLADWGTRGRARRGPTPQGSDLWRSQQNYGPEGMALLLAACADGCPAGLIGMTGVVLLFVATGHGVLAVIASWMAGIGIVGCLVGLVRAVQGARAGRIYRNGRPFVRPGGRG